MPPPDLAKFQRLVAQAQKEVGVARNEVATVINETLIAPSY